MAFSRIGIIGVGLLGGSIGLALKAAGAKCRIVGYGHRQSTLEKAAEYGVIEEWSVDLAEAVKGADLVILCTPVGLFAELMPKLAESLESGAVVTDVGSTKRTVARLAKECLPRRCSFVGSHPMAGSEKRGVEYARADLFQNATCIVTPTAGTAKRATAEVEEFWRMLGMRVVRLSPEEHDAAISDISHLPHVVAGALVAMQADSALPLAGKGFLDTTRVASGDGALWRDILLDNADNVKASLDRMERELKTLRKLLSAGKGEALVKWLEGASGRRDSLVKAKLAELAGE